MVNFRDSASFGKTSSSDKLGQYGNKMQNDFLFATHRIVDPGIAGQNALIIVDVSYGAKAFYS